MHGGTTIKIFIVIELCVIFNIIKVVRVFLEMQQWFPFTLLSSNETFRTAAKNIKVLSSSRKELLTFV
jgi:hypothetical protein